MAMAHEGLREWTATQERRKLVRQNGGRLYYGRKQWHNVIDEIEHQIKDFGNKFPRGAAKNGWMNFYSEAARHFFFLKEAWRNHVSHNRVVYDETSARSAMEHVRDFMNHLSLRLNEPI